MNTIMDGQLKQSSNRRPVVKGDKSKILVTIKSDNLISDIRRPYSSEFLNQQCCSLEGDERVRISCICEDQILTFAFYDDVQTLYDGFQRGLSVSGDKPCLGWKPAPDKPYTWMTYKQVDARATAIGAGLLGIGLSGNNVVHIGIYSQNRPEYVICDQALYRHSLIGVPLYDTLGEDACIFIVNQAELSVIICDNNGKINKLLALHKKMSKLQTLIFFDEVDEKNKSLAMKLGVKLLHIDEVEKYGQENPVAAKPPLPNNLCMVCYTSGTTGAPKGVMLTHGNIMACVSGGLKVLQAAGLLVTSDDCFFSYLPLAHSYERVLEAAALMSGSKIGFFQGDIKKLMDDIKELKPTVFPSVPRLLNRFYDKIMTNVSVSKLRKFLFDKAISSKKQELKKGIIRNTSIWDKMIFQYVQAALGGRVRVITTGSAPISETVLTVLRCIVGCPILEGYGQTENSGVCSLTLVGDSKPGHVGPPLPCNFIKLIDVPEMNYYSKDNKGEICLSGPNVFVGYLKDEEKTKEALDASGWLHTGDIGEWLPNGTLKIIDRKKHIFKLAQGEYIAPEKIENILVQSPWVAQAYVHGDSLQSYIVAVIVPDAETIPGLASKHGINENVPELLQNLVVKKIILNDLTEVGKKNGLSTLEQVKDIKLHPEMFSVENGFLTPTFKLKRYELVKFFARDIAQMYETEHN